MAGRPKGVKKGDNFYKISVFANIMGFGIMAFVYSHHILYMLPRFYPLDDPNRDFKLGIEYFLIALSLYAILGCFVIAMLLDPGFSHNDNPKKITKESFDKLIKMSVDANETKGYLGAPTYKQNFENLVSRDIKQFKDNYDYGLYGEKGERFRYPRTHHCSVGNSCIYFMDHHCTWLNNCVGFRNHRYFVTLLFVCSISCFYYNLYAFPLYYELMIKTGAILSPHSVLFLSWENLLHINSYHAALGVTIVLGFHFVKIVSCMSKGLSTLEYKRDGNDATYDLEFDRNWELSFGKPLFPFSWLFTPWLGERKTIDEYMQELYGFELDDKE